MASDISLFSEARKDKLATELNKDPLGWKEIRYKGEMVNLPIYRLDLNLLLFNELNGRIGSHIQTHVRQYGEITEEGRQDLIQRFLWDSNESRNKKTLKNLETKGQLEPGIITKDGVIIDGNRRAMLLNKLASNANESEAYFKAIVLPDVLESNKKEILRLETEYQIGADEKVQYGPIEKYLKCRDMSAYFKPAEIAEMMGLKAAEIEKYLGIMELMDRYLEYIGCEKLYTRLEKTEDLFINLHNVLGRWENGTGKLKWNPDESDKQEYQEICFDHIRYSYNHKNSINPKDIRTSLICNSQNGIFSYERVWEEFRDSHFEAMDKEVEPSLDTLADDSVEENVGLDKIAKRRDVDWAEKAHSHIQGNWGRARESVGNRLNSQEPAKLLQQVEDKLETLLDLDFRGKVLPEGFLDQTNRIRKMAEELRNNTRKGLGRQE